MAEYDAIIIGGGVAGSSCAILLAQAGWSVALVEKQAFPRRKVCGECIAASNLALFDALGIGEALRALAGPPLQRVAWCAGDTRLETPLPVLARAHGAAGNSAGGVAYDPYGRALGREYLDALLLRRAREVGAVILQPCRVRGAERVGDRQRCTLEPASGAIEAALLIDAHGSWQRNPLVRALPRPARASDLLAFKANFSSASLAAGVLPVLAFEGGYGGMVQGDHGLLTIACCIRRDRLQRARAELPGASAGAVVQMLLMREIGAVRDTLASARREGAWLAAGPLAPRAGNPRPARDIFAVGNAAGEAHPILGEGISMAVQSAFLLCERLVTRDRTAIDGYAAAWQRAFAWRIRLAALCAHIAMRPRATRALQPVLRAAPQLLALAARLGGKTRTAVAPRSFAERRPSHDATAPACERTR